MNKHLIETSNMERVNKVEHVWCDSDDRWIYLEYNEINKIVGVNFMQGDDYVHFKKNWCVSDQGLTEFYKEMLYTFPIEKASVNTLEFINKCMWAYHAAASYRDEYDENGVIQVHKNNYKHNTTNNR